MLGWDWLEDVDPMISYRRGTFIWNPSTDDPIAHDKVSAIIAAIEDGAVDFQLGDERWTGVPEADSTLVGAVPAPVRALPELEAPVPGLVSAMEPMSTLFLQGGGDRDPTTIPIWARSDWYVGAVAAHDRLKAVCDPYPDLVEVPGKAYPSLLAAAQAERRELMKCY